MADSASALITLASLQERSEIPDGVDETQFENLITMVSAAIESHCRRTLRQPATATDYYYNGDGGRVLLLRQYPVDTDTFKVYTAYEEATIAVGDLVPSASYMLDSTNGIVKLKGDLQFYPGFRTVKVTDKPGYTLSTMPQDIRLACIDWCIACIGQKDLSIQGEKLPAGQVSYSLAAMPRRVKVLLGGHVYMGDV